MLLKEKIKINSLELNNRLVMPPMATYKTADGKVNDAVCEHYTQRAQGGYVGMIITEHSTISRQGLAGIGQITVDDDSAIEGLERLAKAIKADGTAAVGQINHAGSATTPEITGGELVSASAVANPGRKSELQGEALPRALTVEEILEIEEQFVQAALRFKKAGFDAVEIHSAHGYLLNQFYSPLTNQRHDEYGADSVENRCRFQTETIKKVRKAVGDDYPVFIRLGGCDYMAGGSSIDDAVQACRLFEEAGADLIDLTGGMCRFTRADNTEPGYFSDLSSACRRAVFIPVVLTGGVKTAEQAEELLQNGSADLIGVGRAMLANARWAEQELNK